MHAEREPMRMRQWIDQGMHEMRLGRDGLAIFAAHRIDAVAMIAAERGDFVGEKPRAIHQAARFDFSQRAGTAERFTARRDALYLGGRPERRPRAAGRP